MSFEQRTVTVPIVQMYPGRAFAAPFTPGRDGQVKVHVVVGAEPCLVKAELREPSGHVMATFTGKLAEVQFNVAIVVGTPATPTWVVHLTNTSPTVVGGGDVVISYPAEVDEVVVPLAKLNELAVIARKEIHPRLWLASDQLHLSIDERFAASLPPKLASFANVIPLPGLPDVTITKLDPVTKLKIRFVPGTQTMPHGFVEVVATIDHVGAEVLSIGVGGARQAVLTMRVGVGASRDRIALGPVEVVLDWSPSGLANLNLIKTKICGYVGDALTAAIATTLVKPLRKATEMVMHVYRMAELIDVRITAAGLTLRHVRAPKLTPPPPDAKAPPPRGRLQHLVVVMMENRSYDHMLRSLFVARPDLGTAEPYHETFAGRRYDVEPSATSKVKDDPPHGSRPQIELQGAGRWVEAYDRAHRDKPAAKRHDDPGEVLRYQPASHVPMYAHLAEHACVCLDWRAAIPGQTWPNRNYALSGTSSGVLDNAAGGFDFYDIATVCDVLEAQDVAWNYFRSDVTFLELYRRWALDQRRIKPIQDFLDNAAAGKLPRVCWVEPNIADFGSERGSDDHPPADVKYGQGFVRTVYEALRSYSERAVKNGDPTAHDWLLVVTYDEHGGFWDSKQIGDPIDDDHPRTTQRGFRVPAFLVSPWLGRSTTAVPLDHASLVRTILEQFCGPEEAVGGLIRVKRAASLADVLDGGVGAGWPQPRPEPVIPKAAPILSAAFYPPKGGIEAGPDTAVDADGVTSELWRRVRAAQATMRAQRASEAAIGGGGNESAIQRGNENLIVGAIASIAPRPTAPPLYPGATGEGLGLWTADLDLPDAIARATGWELRPFGADERARLLVPPGPVAVRELWERAQALRDEFPDADIEPLWDVITRALAEDDEREIDPRFDPEDRQWALKAVKAREAWDHRSPSGRHRGAGIVVAHLDTGWTDHRELGGVFNKALGWDFVGHDAEAQDPLIAGPGWFPGHGTRTASVLASRERDGGVLVGAAPEATLIEFRVSRSVVHLSTTNMTLAIEAAVSAGAHVISISSGGVWSRALHRAVRAATRRGVIVVAAAGNYVHTVVWPARYPEVIAAGASTIARRAWRWSSVGARIALSAPGAGVWCAEATGDLTQIRRGAGTSHATALIAGAIATWLSFHGRDQLLALYGASGLAAAAKRFLVETASRPGIPGLGAGELDMLALVTARTSLDLRGVFGRGLESALAEAIVDEPRTTVDEERTFFVTMGDLTGEPWRALAETKGTDRLRAVL